jgi:hypothetical protein
MTKKYGRFILDGCPHCGGDLVLDAYEEEFFCFQCARRINPAQLMRLRKAAFEAERGGEEHGILAEVRQGAELVAEGR